MLAPETAAEGIRPRFPCCEAGGITVAGGLLATLVLINDSAVPISGNYSDSISDLSESKWLSDEMKQRLDPGAGRVGSDPRIVRGIVSCRHFLRSAVAGSALVTSSPARRSSASDRIHLLRKRDPLITLCSDSVIPGRAASGPLRRNTGRRKASWLPAHHRIWTRQGMGLRPVP